MDDGIERPVRSTALIFVPTGYSSAEEFAKDCGFELAKFNAIQMLDAALSQINFDGMDPNSFTIAEIRRSMPGYAKE